MASPQKMALHNSPVEEARGRDVSRNTLTHCCLNRTKLVGTHCDSNKDENMEDLLKTVAKDVKASQCIEVSAQDGTNIEELLREAVKLGIEFRERGEPKIGKKSKCHLL